MEITDTIKDSVLKATAKALATNGPAGLNVVPVSVVAVTAEAIYLYDFFMDKTRKNLSKFNTPVALTCWEGLTGVQIKATASYVNNGEIFDAAVIEMSEKFPDRTLKGLVALTPKACFDVSADTTLAGKKIS